MSLAHPQGCCLAPLRDSLRVFSSLCQIFSEEDNYSQSRELLLQVRPYSLVFPATPAPCATRATPISPRSVPSLPPAQEAKLQPSLEPNSKKAPRSGSRGGVSDQLGGGCEGVRSVWGAAD